MDVGVVVPGDGGEGGGVCVKAWGGLHQYQVGVDGC